jgi:hypothetical protein
MKKLVFALLLAAAALPLAAQSSSHGCVAVTAGSPQKNGGKFDASFSATQVIDIDFSIVFTPGAAQRFSGDHLVEFRISGPRGHLYQSMTIPFTADDAHGKKVAIPTYPAPVETKTLAPTQYAGAQHMYVAATLPVAGTSIVSNGLYGTWTAQAYVDGDPLACSQPVRFTITP